MESLDFLNRKCVSSKTAGIIVVGVLTALVLSWAVPYFLERIRFLRRSQKRVSAIQDNLGLDATAHRASRCSPVSRHGLRIAEKVWIAKSRKAAHARKAAKLFDRMTELILDKGLCSSEPPPEVRDIARVRTLTVVRGLDGERKASAPFST